MLQNSSEMKRADEMPVHLRLLVRSGFLLLCLLVFGGASCRTTQSTIKPEKRIVAKKPKMEKRTPPKPGKRLVVKKPELRTVKRAVPSKPVAKKDDFKFFRVRLKLRVGYGRMIRTRIYEFISARVQKKEKKLKVSNKGAGLSVLAKTYKPDQFALTGVFTVDGKNIPVEIQPQKITSMTELKKSTHKKLGNGEVWVEAVVKMLKALPKEFSSNFRMDFNNVQLLQMLRKLAEVNQLTLAVESKIPEDKRFNMKLKAPSRKGLLLAACQKANLVCKIAGKIVRVNPKK